MVVYRLPLIRCHIPSVIKRVRGVQGVKREEPGARRQNPGVRRMRRDLVWRGAALLPIPD